MRARNIKPGFYRNEQLAECSPWARLVFPGLWMLADREGRLEYRPKRIKAELLPFDGEDMAALIGELEAQGLVVRYAVDGVEYLWIPTFARHQNPHQREKPSVIPPCPAELEAHARGQSDASPVQAPDKHEASTSLASCQHGSGTSPARLNPESLILNPESYPPVDIPVNEDPARSLERPTGGDGEKPPVPDGDAPAVDLDGPGLEFVELRDAYNAVRPEGPLAGFPEYKQLKAARDRTGRSRYPGNARLIDDFTARMDAGFWNPGYALGLAQYLKTRLWEQPVKARASPGSKTSTDEVKPVRTHKERMAILQAAEEGAYNEA